MSGLDINHFFQTQLPEAFDGWAKDNPKSIPKHLVLCFDLQEKKPIQWTVQISKKTCQCRQGLEEDADTTITFKAGILEKWINNDLNLPLALAMGKIKVKGDYESLVSLKGLLEYL